MWNIIIECFKLKERFVRRPKKKKKENVPSLFLELKERQNNAHFSLHLLLLEKKKEKTTTKHFFFPKESKDHYTRSHNHLQMLSIKGK